MRSVSILPTSKRANWLVSSLHISVKFYQVFKVKKTVDVLIFQEKDLIKSKKNFEKNSHFSRVLIQVLTAIIISNRLRNKLELKR